jgi:hypothetical protein
VLETGKGSSLQRALIPAGLVGAGRGEGRGDGGDGAGRAVPVRFESGAKAGEAFVVGTSVQVTGSAGEVYARFSEVPLPLVTAKTKDNRLLVRAKAMDPPTSAEWSKRSAGARFSEGLSHQERCGRRGDVRARAARSPAARRSHPERRSVTVSGVRRANVE